MKYAALALLVFMLGSCSRDYRYTGDPLDYVPGDAALILETPNPDLFFSNLRNNLLIRQNNEHPLYHQLQQQLSFIQHFEHAYPAVLAFANLGEKIHYTLIIKGIPEIDSLSDVQHRQVETIKYGKTEFTKYTLDNQVSYVGSVDSLLLISDSEDLLRQSLEGEHLLTNSNDLARARRATSKKKTNLYVNHEAGVSVLKELLPNADLSGFESFSSWTGVDVDITQSGILLNGVSTSTASNKLINVFQGMVPGSIEAPKITPIDSKGFMAVSLEDFHHFQENLNKYNGMVDGVKSSTQEIPDSIPPPGIAENSKKVDSLEDTLQEEIQTRQVFESREEELLAGAQEIALVYHSKGNVLAIRPEEILGAQHRFDKGENSEVFHGLPIFEYQPEQAFENILSPLFQIEKMQAYTILDHFYLFSGSRSSLEDFIISYQNQQVLEQSESLMQALSYLSNSSSLLLVYQNDLAAEELARWVSQKHQKTTSDLDFTDHPLTAVQFVYQNDYAHVHAYLDQAKSRTATHKGINQSASVQLDAPVATRPVFFSNHRSKGLDLAVQDMDNTLYLISAEGQIYWKKPLQTRILGDIQEVDLLKNGRIQLAFVTQNKLHVLDRNGNPVKPFPLEFKDEITQPLGLFDYSNTRDYRFVVVQDKEVHMYNRRGQKVKGFGFTSAESELIQPLKHIRIGNKDYILAMEASGKLNILNRRGEIRVPVKEEFEFSENPWYEYENQFVSTNQDGALVSISESGKITREALGLAKGHRITATPKTLVSLSENSLRIKDKEVTLDFGLYTEPQIFYLNNKLYISVTDLQAQRVYIFDSNAQLLPDFPVFGTSGIDLGNADSDGDLEFVVQGDQNTILIYQFPGS